MDGWWGGKGTFLLMLSDGLIREYVLMLPPKDQPKG